MRYVLAYRKYGKIHRFTIRSTYHGGNTMTSIPSHGFPCAIPHQNNGIVALIVDPSESYWTAPNQNRRTK